MVYANDLVLLAPSWRALQSLLRAVEVAGVNINMTFNTLKPFVWFLIFLTDVCKIIIETFPAFTLCDSPLLFVNKFKYLGHIIDHSFSDDSDISREIRSCSQEPMYCVDVSNDAHWL